MKSTRRSFVIQSALFGAALVGARTVVAAAPTAMVAETDAQATALGYKADASKVDKAKFPKYTAEQKCAGCALYQGKAGEKAGGCALFPGKQVSAAGWCSAWAKKA